MLPPEKSLLSYVRTNQLRATTDDAGVILQGRVWGAPHILGPGGFAFRKTGYVMIPYDKKIVNFTLYAGGAEQSWTVPQDVFYVYVKLWGSGGGGGQTGGWTHGGMGGAGGHTRGLLSVVPNSTLNIRVPRGGQCVPLRPGPLGGGGPYPTNVRAVPPATPGVNDHRYCGGGGGYCGIFSGGVPLMIAGGGGGGGSHSGTWDYWTHGGAGGGAQGQSGTSPVNNWSYENRNLGGGGGTQSGGGSGSQAHTSHMGAAGSYLQGGNSVSTYTYGGCGGGGFWGGGAGSHSPGGSHMTGGGGGSGYIHPRVMLGETFTGAWHIPPMIDDPDYPGTLLGQYAPAAYGGDMGNQGGDGHVVIYY